MPALWLAQLLCPLRHAICALAYDRTTTPPAEIDEKLNVVAKGRVGGIDPWCGLCGSRDLRIEHGKLFTDDWDEALKTLRRQEQENLHTREMFKRSNN